MTLEELITVRSVIDTVTPRNSKEISDLTEAKRILDRDINLKRIDPRKPQNDTPILYNT